METTGVHGAVTEEANADVALAFVFRRVFQSPADTDSQGNIAAHDAVAAGKAMRFIE